MIEIKNLSKVFHTAGGDVEALKDIDLRIEDGDIFGIIGLSGAGKSTLVRCMNLLEVPSEGRVLVDGKELTALPPRELRKARQSISMIFQGFNLLMQRTALDNICFPLELAGVKKQEARQRAKELLELVELPDKADASAARSSGWPSPGPWPPIPGSSSATRPPPPWTPRPPGPSWSCCGS